MELKSQNDLNHRRRAASPQSIWKPQACRLWGFKSPTTGGCWQASHRAHLRASGGREYKNLTPSGEEEREKPREGTSRGF